MSVIRFAIDTRPVCVWDISHQETTDDFLDNLEPEYFSYQAHIHEEHIRKDNDNFAALSLRMGYSHALETLFSLLSASIQAPDCIYGWLANYRNYELMSFVEKVTTKSQIFSKLKKKPIEWIQYSKIVHRNLNIEDPIHHKKICLAFGKLWNKLAYDFMEEDFKLEYNSIKHGFRIKQGGFGFSIIGNDTKGKTLQRSSSLKFEGSKYGTTSHILDPLFESKTNYNAAILQRNWYPDNLVRLLDLISYSLYNLKSYLQLSVGSKNRKVRYVIPQDMADFDRPWNKTPDVSSGRQSFRVELPRKELLSKEVILSVYENK